MNTADEIATKIEPTKRRSADPVAGSGDMLHKFDERFRTLKDLQQTSAKPAENLSNKQLEELNERLDSLVRPGPQREPAGDLHNLALGIDRHLDQRTSEPTAIFHRLAGIENKMKKRSSRGFTRYLLAVCIGVAATLAWQSYGEAAKQMFAAKAPELGWSPETKQMIANWVEQLGWTKPPATHESTAVRSSATETPQAAPVAQTAPAAVAPSVPVAPSIDPAEVHQIAMDLTALRQTVAQITAGQDQMARKVDKLQAANQEVLVKMIPEPPPPPPTAAAPAVAARPAPGGVSPSENTQNTGPTSASIALRASCGPDVQRLCRGISIENGDVIKCLSSHRMELSPTCDLYFKEMPVDRAAQKGAPKATSPSPVTPPSSRAPVPPRQ